ncbi:MAG: hypothetical protein JW715_05755 [Sedimentisphaerales bacterium]|nr:hypothetical protein [Sedimentisphaerales bacterium]
MMKRYIYGVLGILAIYAGLSIAAPEPAIVQGPSQWTIDAEYTHPQQIVLRNAANNKPVAFWYIIVTLTNNTGQDVGFYPKCDLMTDTFRITPEGKDVSPAVFEGIKSRHKNKYPFLKPMVETDNKLLQGEDNTKDVVFIWPDFGEETKVITFFITGLSNETAVVEHPVEKDQDGRPQKVYLRKTLELTYAVKNDPASRYGVELNFKSKRWIMR